MKVKTKLIASIMSICLVCAVFAIGVFALKTANLKIGGDVSFSATGVEAHIRNASVSGAVTPTELAASDAKGEVINTSMTQSDIDTTFATWNNIKLDFDADATDIELKFEIANTSANADNYIEIRYNYSFNNENPNADVIPGDENTSGTWVNNNYILSPKGTAESATYETFTLKFRVVDKELNVPEATKVNLTIELKHTVPVDANSGWTFTTDSPATGQAALTAFTAPENWNGVVNVPAVVKNGANNYIVTKIQSKGGLQGDPSTNGFFPAATKEVVFPNSIKSTVGCLANAQNTEMTIINLPVSLQNLGDFSFYAAVFSNIYLPNSLISLGLNVFNSCVSLNSIVIPERVTSIGERAFYGCTGLQLAKFEVIEGWTLHNGGAVTQITAEPSLQNAKLLTETYVEKLLLRTAV